MAQTWSFANKNGFLAFLGEENTEIFKGILRPTKFSFFANLPFLNLVHLHR